MAGVMTESYRILIVDDDPAQRELVSDFLKVSGSFTVAFAGDLQTLWASLESNTFDLILMDYKLPDGTGLDGLEGLKARKYFIPVIMITGQGDERVAVQAMQRGATDYLLKSSDYLVSLPTLIRSAIRSYQLQQSVQRSLDQIRYQATLLNNVRDAIVVWDMDGKITYWNPSAIGLYGWSPNERLGCDVGEVYLNTFNPPIRTPREGETIGHHIERQCQTRHHKQIWVSSRITVLYDTGNTNRLIGYMDVSHDITKSKEAEQALRTERNFVSAILDTVGALVIVLDRDGRIVRFNRTCEQITGYSLEEVRGQNIWDLFYQPQDMAQIQGVFQKIQEGQYPVGYESSWVTRQGKRRRITWANTALTDRTGKVEYIIATGLDITERKIAEDALRHRVEVEGLIADISANFINLAPEEIDPGIQQALQAIGEYIGVDRCYVALLSEDGNAATLKYEWCAEGIKPHREINDAIHTNWLPWSIAQLRRSKTVHIPSVKDLPPEASAELEFMTSQSIRSVVAVPLIYSGAMLGFLGFDSVKFELNWAEEDLALLRMAGEAIVNALQRKRMDAQIRAAQTHLTQSARLATIGELASGVAHQINNPLTTIIAEAQILMRNMSPSASERDSIDLIEKAGWRLQEVVQRLLEFSRPATTTLEPVLVSESIRRALALVGAHIEAAGVSLQIDLAQDLPPVKGNARQLEDLWVNLLLLARDATNGGGGHTIQVVLQPGADNTVMVEVKDDGIPIPAAQMASLFEPNFIGSEIGRGTGMELSICREIVRQHGGQISAESVFDHVTIFKVTLPLEERATGN